MKTNRLINIVFFCLLIFYASLALYGWKVKGVSFDSDPIVGIQFYVITTFFVFSSLVVILNRNKKSVLALFISSVFCTAYTIEISISILDPVAEKHPLQLAAESQGTEWYSGNIWELSEELDEQIYPSTYVSLFWDGKITYPVIDDQRILPLSGVAGVQTWLCNEGGQPILYRSDRYGFNNPDLIYTNSPIDIAVVGDSFAQGMCVDRQLSMVGHVRREFPNTLSFGNLGSGSLIYLAMLEEYAQYLEPSIVLWMHFDNDFHELEDEKNDPILVQYIDEGYSQNLRGRFKEIERQFKSELLLKQHKPKVSVGPITWVNRVILFRNILDRLEKFKQKKQYERKLPPDLSTYKDVLRRANNSVASWGGRLIFVRLPGWSTFTNPDSEDPVFLIDGSTKKMLQVVKSLDIPVINIYDVFAKHADPLSLFRWRLNSHYNEEGHRLAANAILQELALIP